MNKFEKLIKKTDLEKTNENTQRDGDTSAASSKRRFIPIDGRKLRRVDRPHQFNTKISSDIHEELYRIVMEKGITITEIVETALRDYFAKLSLEESSKDSN